MTQGTSRKRGMKDCKNENNQSLLEMTSKTRLEQYQYQWTFQQERENFLGFHLQTRTIGNYQLLGGELAFLKDHPLICYIIKTCQP